MNALTRFLQEPVVERLGWTLLHFVWQGAAVAALLAVVLLVLRGRSANARYLAGCAALLAMAACPAVTFSRLAPAAPMPVPEVPMAALPQAFTPSAPPANSLPSSISAVSREARDAVYSTAADLSRANPPLSKRVRHFLDEAMHSVAWLSPWLALVWIGGVALLSVKLFGGWLLTRRLAGRGTRALVALEETLTKLAVRVGVSRTVRLLESAVAEVPTMIGWLRPVILLPASALTGLSASQLEAILAHELATSAATITS